MLGDDKDGNTYLVEEHTKQYKEIDYWVSMAKDIQKRYGKRVKFWADSARPEHVSRFKREFIDCFNAKKSVISGIESVAKLIKTGHFFVVEEAIESFLDEIYQYVWDEKSGLPVKENDDVMDAIRYAIYNTHERIKAKVTKKPSFFYRN